MKKIFALALLASLILASCSSNDNDNGPAANTLFFEDTEISVSENDGTITFPVRLSGSVQGGFTVNFETRDGTATQPGDYISNTGTLTFNGNNGERQNIVVNINEDTFREDTEEFMVTLSGISTNQIDIDPDIATAVIIDEVDLSGNLLSSGSSANDILTNSNFDRLLVQIGYVNGFRPTQQTIANFSAYLSERTFKQDIEIDFLELDSPDEETLTLQEIADLESENRTAYNNGTSTMTIYIYFADSPSDGDDLDRGLVTLGAVYRNTSMVIFEQTIRTLSSRSRIPLTDVETATLNHEFGHLFGLVDLGTVPVNDHEDILRDEDGNPVLDENGNEQGNNHCNVDGCLMQAQLTFQAPAALRAFMASTKEEIVSACSLSGSAMIRLLEDRAARGLSTVPNLDAECILDLQNNGGR